MNFSQRTRTGAWRLTLPAALVAVTAICSMPAQAADIVWRTSLSAAQQEAKRLNRPLVVNFTATWCGPCQTMKRTTFKDARLVAESRKWVMVQIDIDKDKATSSKYKIEAVPTTLILKPSGTVVSRAVGGMNAGTMIKWLQSKYAAARR